MYHLLFPDALNLRDKQAKTLLAKEKQLNYIIDKRLENGAAQDDLDRNDPSQNLP